MSKLFKTFEDGHDAPRRHSKATVVGVGAVGMACAYSIVNQGLVRELALVDVNADKLRGEAMDLQQGKSFMKHCKVVASTDYAVTAGSDIIIITAGVRQREGESRLDLVGRNLGIFKHIVPSLMKHSAHPTICVVSNPCDIMTWVTWRLSGLPRCRVFGSGTALDSSRLRALVSDKLGVDARSVHGYILGEHGDSSVAAWSGLNVGGVRLAEANPAIGTEDDPDNWEAVHQAVINSAYEVIKAKGYTSWAIGLTVAALTEAVLRNEQRVLPVSTFVQGLYGIDEDVCLSLPAVLGSSGVRQVLRIPLSDAEAGKLQGSASTIWGVQRALDFGEDTDA
jgi:L-lactate dehydrogenase